MIRLLGTEPHHIMEVIAASPQTTKRAEKDVKRAQGVMKQKKVALTCPIDYHHQDDIYYVVLTCNLMHSMMGEARLDANMCEVTVIYNIMHSL